MVLAKAALVSGLQALPGLAGVRVTWGFEAKPPAEVIIVGRIDPNSQDPANLGNLEREENYLIHVTVNVLAKKSQEWVETRAVELAGEVKRFLDADPSLGLPRVVHAAVSEQGLRDAVTGNGRMAEIPMRVSVKARLPRS
jgi:hypothetical protein